MYLQATFPEAMFYAGGRFEISSEAGIPPLPEGFEELGAEEQAILKRHQWEAVVQKYHMELIKKDARHLTALGHPYAPLFIQPIIFAPRTWLDGIHHLKRSLMLIQTHWDAINDAEICPLAFSPEEIARTVEVAEQWESYDDRVRALSRELGVEIDGRIDEVEKFELVKRKSDELRSEWNPVTEGGPYPFQDGGRSLVA